MNMRHIRLKMSAENSYEKCRRKTCSRSVILLWADGWEKLRYVIPVMKENSASRKQKSIYWELT